MLVFDGGRLHDASGHEVAWPGLAVLGDPVAHSLSPRLHTAALRARGLDHDYAAIRVGTEDLATCLVTAAEHGVLGLNLTVPHKEHGLALCAQVSDEAREIGAANTLVRRRDRWHAHNTDARGLALALQSWRGRRLARSLDQVVVIGSGGAARSAVVCARALGSRRIRVLARRPERATWATAMGAVAEALPERIPTTATLILQCTPLGLDPELDPSPLSLDGLASTAIVVDLTYADRPSAFLRQAIGRGVDAIDGRRMLVAQAALAFSMWFGAQPPLTAMGEVLGLEF